MLPHPKIYGTLLCEVQLLPEIHHFIVHLLLLLGGLLKLSQELSVTLNLNEHHNKYKKMTPQSFYYFFFFSAYGSLTISY